MSDFRDDRRPDDGRNDPRAYARAGGIWNVAAFSVAALFCSVLGARMLAQMVERGDLPTISIAYSDRSLRRLANSAPGPQAPQTVTIIRSVGLDGVTTATIPPGPAAPLAPCGGSK